MERAAILVGVNTTGQLPVLRAAVSGAVKMAEWASKQRIPAEQIKLITDEKDTVTVARIKAAIDELVNLKFVEQLVVYFAGHGMYTHGSEFWLLTDAPGDSDEAVNVARSQDNARIGAFTHVIFISDACRTAAVGRQFQEVRGSSIFPSPEQPARPERSVDLFFACGFDTPSVETSGSTRSTTWQSIYTDTLHDALSGDYPLLLDSESVHGDAAVVRTQRLKPFLTDTVPGIIIKAGFGADAVQTPDARVCSPSSAWISQISPPPAAFTQLIESGGMPTGFRKMANRTQQSETTLAQEAASAALSDWNIAALQSLPKRWIPFTDAIELQEVHAAPQRLTIAATANRIRRADAQAPKSFETACGFLLSGVKPAEAQVINTNAKVEEITADAIKIRTDTIANVLLTFGNGQGTVLPAIPGYIATLTFQGELLVSVSWQQVGPIEDPNLQELRALVASLSQRGAFHLDVGGVAGRKNAQLLANRIRDAKMVDPSMAIYAAYAFYDLQLIDRIEAMATFLTQRLQLAFFDFALLTRSIDLLSHLGRSRFFPFFPLLSRGWSLLSPEMLPPLLSGLYAHLTRSLWTLFDSEGVAKIKAAIRARELN